MHFRQQMTPQNSIIDSSRLISNTILYSRVKFKCVVWKQGQLHLTPRSNQKAPSHPPPHSFCPLNSDLFSGRGWRGERDFRILHDNLSKEMRMKALSWDTGKTVSQVLHRKKPGDARELRKLLRVSLLWDAPM